jgi:hypothetical protein
MMSIYLTEAIILEKSRSLAYYFCVGQDVERNNASAVLRGLLWQLTGQDASLMQYLAPYFDPPERGQATLSSEETLWELFKDVCRHANAEQLYCLIDGVDECDEDSIHWLVDKCMSVEGKAVFQKLSMMVLSRHITGLDDSFCITLDPHHRAQVKADVAIFVRSKVDQLSRKLHLDNDFGTNVASTLLDKSEGTFLWVGFAMNELLRKKTRIQIEKAMYNLPKGLPAVYARMLQNVAPHDRDHTKELLTWASLAFRKLSLKAFADILDCRNSPTISEEQATLDEIAICAPILHLREHGVEFVHQSAKDYLLRDQVDHDPVLEEFRIMPESAHLRLTRRCLRSLAEGTYLKYYSLMNWPKHAKCLSAFASHLFEQELPFFGEISPLRDAWWRKYGLNFAGLPETVPPRLHIACFLGLETWARAILSDEENSGKSPEQLVGERCSGGWLALDYAAESASEGSVKLLLATPNDRLPSKQLESSIRRAVLTQRPKTVRTLLSVANAMRGTVMHLGVATWSGDSSLRPSMIRSLSLAGADVNAKDLYRTTALHIVIQQNDCLETVRALCECGADVNAQDLHGETALHRAVRRHGRCMQLVQTLNHAGANLDAQNINGKTPLHIAIKSNSLPSANALVDGGASLDVRDVNGDTVLHIAMRDAMKELFPTLLEKSTNVHERDSAQDYDQVASRSPLVSKADRSKIRIENPIYIQS